MASKNAPVLVCFGGTIYIKTHEEITTTINH